MDLLTALDVRRRELTAFVGAGGKTTAAWRLARLLAGAGERVIFTTTTHVFRPRHLPLLLDPEPASVDVARRLTEGSPILFLAAACGEAGEPAQAADSPYAAVPTKLVGLDPYVLNRLVPRLPEVTWLVEADGARGRLLKAPAAHEPVIPAVAHRVVVLAGLDALGRPLDARTVHRPDLAANLIGVAPGAAITARHLAALIGHPYGGLKKIPPGVRAVVLLTQRQGDQLSPLAGVVARRLLSSTLIDRVVAARLWEWEADAALRVWE